MAIDGISGNQGVSGNPYSFEIKDEVTVPGADTSVLKGNSVNVQLTTPGVVDAMFRKLMIQSDKVRMDVQNSSLEMMNEFIEKMTGLNETIKKNAEFLGNEWKGLNPDSDKAKAIVSTLDGYANLAEQLAILQIGVPLRPSDPLEDPKVHQDARAKTPAEIEAELTAIETLAKDLNRQMIEIIGDEVAKQQKINA